MILQCPDCRGLCLNEHILQVASILESHLEEEEDELTANDNDESCWQDEEQGNDQGIQGDQ